MKKGFIFYSGMIDLWPEIQDALKKDLGLSPDNADLFSQMITIKEVILL